MTGLAVLIILMPSNQLSAQEPGANDRFFIEKIEPLLKRHCFECHSHASGEISGGLTLDSKSGWEIGGEHGPAVVPKRPNDSLLIKAVRREDDGLKMPPGEKLSAAEIELLIEWISRDAPDPRPPVEKIKKHGDPLDWWSLRPLPKVHRRSDGLPDDAAKSHVSGSIDAFITQKLQEAGLSPAPVADRRTLIRRLYFDLHGLPPTPEEVSAFVADTNPLAYENLIDRLLNSPRYGERFARHWLDVVHFADSHGCEHDVFRPNAWRYRDYVIDSFNRDTPWPRFIREQLAADQFFPAETQLTAALGFIAAGPLELSRAGTAPITFDYLDRDDMVTQTMATFTSTTANCARCHDHKFDPITQDDYYSLQAVFAGVGKGDVEFDADPSVAAERRNWNDLLTAAIAGDQTAMATSEYSNLVQQWEAEFVSKSASWEPLRPLIFLSSGGATLKRMADDSVIATDVRPDQDTYTITAATSVTNLTALRLDVLADESLPMKGPGRQDNGNLHLTEFEAFIFDSQSEQPVKLKIRQAVADWNQQGWTIAHTLDGDPKTAWGIFPKVGESHHAVFELEQPLELSPGSQIVVLLKQLHGGGHLIGRLRLYATDAVGAAAQVVPEQVRTALKYSPDERSVEQQTAVAAHVLQIIAEQKLAALPPMSAVYGVSSSYLRAAKLPAPTAPRVVHVLKRGDIEKPGDVALPGALAAVMTLPGRFSTDDSADEASRRAALADWLAASENPLTWRSTVNRVWGWHFDRGICDTPNDFGRMGGIPTHPELLDWLAVWFRDEARGSLKQLHRLILNSQTYQRQSRMALSDNVANDSRNRLLWRANRRVLDAESYRDAVLQISGRIDLTMGGPGVQQFTQTPGAQATPKLDYDAFDWDAPAAARRSIYRVVWRGIADPFMESLDFPDLGLLAPRRESSVSALQALTLLNNDFVLHHSQVLCDKLTVDGSTIDQQICNAIRLIYLREPADGERKMLEVYAGQHGLAALCRVLLNSSEFLFVD